MVAQGEGVRKILVLGRNAAEIEAWIQGANDRYRRGVEFVTVTRYEQVLGLRNPLVVEIGAAELHPEYERMYRTLVLNGATWLSH